jgi:hypothetical protein
MRAWGTEVVERASADGLSVRIIGGVAVCMHSPIAQDGPLARDYEDLDLMVEKKARSGLDRVLGDLGWEPDRRFNAVNGTERRIYYHPAGPKIDVFVGSFKMCHEVPMDGRLDVDAPTAPLAELVLTKAQVVELTAKDVNDLVALLVEHDLGEDDRDVINRPRIGQVCARDWGLWRTVTGTLDKITTASADLPLTPDQRQRLDTRVAGLQEAIDAAPKSSKWKMRNRVGDRVTWYEVPEDPTVGAQP